jgi:hypothetical protein
VVRTADGHYLPITIWGSGGRWSGAETVGMPRYMDIIRYLDERGVDITGR